MMENDPEIIRLNTILYPSKNDRKKFAEAGNACANFGNVHVALDDINYIPHITLYSPSFPITKIDDIISNIKDFATNTPSLILKLKSITPSASDGGILINYNKNDEVEKIKKQVISTLNPLRNGVLTNKYKNDTSDDVLKYGYPINKYYFPHVTLAVFTDKITRDNFLTNYDFNLPDEILIDKIAICKMGPHGTCVEILNEFELNK